MASLHRNAGIPGSRSRTFPFTDDFNRARKCMKIPDGTTPANLEQTEDPSLWPITPAKWNRQRHRPVDVLCSCHTVAQIAVRGSARPERKRISAFNKRICGKLCSTDRKSVV